MINNTATRKLLEALTKAKKQGTRGPASVSIDLLLDAMVELSVRVELLELDADDRRSR